MVDIHERCRVDIAVCRDDRRTLDWRVVGASSPAHVSAANFRHIVSHVPLDNDTYLVRLTVAIENVGDVLLQLEESVGGIKQLVPVPDYLQPLLQTGVGVERWKLAEIRWPFIDTRRRNRTGPAIESGESAAFDFDLFAPSTVRFVIVYSYFRNVALPEGQGWNTSTFYELEPLSRDGSMIDPIKP